MSKHGHQGDQHGGASAPMPAQVPLPAIGRPLLPALGTPVFVEEQPVQLPPLMGNEELRPGLLGRFVPDVMLPPAPPPPPAPGIHQLALTDRPSMRSPREARIKWQHQKGSLSARNASRKRERYGPHGQHKEQQRVVVRHFSVDQSKGNNVHLSKEFGSRKRSLNRQSHKVQVMEWHSGYEELPNSNLYDIGGELRKTGPWSPRRSRMSLSTSSSDAEVDVEQPSANGTLTFGRRRTYRRFKNAKTYDMLEALDLELMQREKVEIADANDGDNVDLSETETMGLGRSARWQHLPSKTSRTQRPAQPDPLRRPPPVDFGTAAHKEQQKICDSIRTGIAALGAQRKELRDLRQNMQNCLKTGATQAQAQQ